MHIHVYDQQTSPQKPYCSTRSKWSKKKNLTKKQPNPPDFLPGETVSLRSDRRITSDCCCSLVVFRCAVFAPMFDRRISLEIAPTPFSTQTPLSRSRSGVISARCRYVLPKTAAWGCYSPSLWKGRWTHMASIWAHSRSLPHMTWLLSGFWNLWNHLAPWRWTF